MSDRRIRVALAWLPAVLYMGLIWFVSSLSLGSVSLDRFPLQDKGVHFVEYAVLGFLVAHAALRTWPRHHPVRPAALAVLVTVAWALLDEVHQATVPGRTSDVFDLIADFLGATAGASVRCAVHLGLGTTVRESR